MNLTSPVSVVDFVADNSAGDGMEQLAIQRSWRVIDASSVGWAIGQVLQCTPSVVIVKFSARLAEALEMIDLLRLRWPQIPLVAVTDEHHDDIEREVRRAGASCYLAGADLVQLDRAVTEMVNKSPPEINKL